MHDLKWQGIASETPLPLQHQHHWIQAYNVYPVKIFNCACGQRRQVVTLDDGREMDEIITRPGGSLCNLLPLKAGGSVIPVEEVLAAQK